MHVRLGDNIVQLRAISGTIDWALFIRKSLIISKKQLMNKPWQSRSPFYQPQMVGWCSPLLCTKRISMMISS